MVSPITWKNIAVETPQQQAYNPMIAAQLGMTAGFDKLGQVFDQYQTQRKDDNTAAFQQALSQYKTPEEMQAAIASGAVDKLRAEYGVQMNQKVANEAPDARLTGLMTQKTVADTFQNQQLDQQQAPLVDKIRSAIYAGDTAGATAMLDQNPDLRVRSKLFEEMATRNDVTSSNALKFAEASDRFSTNAVNRMEATDRAAENALRRKSEQILLDAKVKAGENATVVDTFAKEYAQAIAGIAFGAEGKPLPPKEATAKLNEIRQGMFERYGKQIPGNELAKIMDSIDPLAKGSPISPQEQDALQQEANSRNVQNQYAIQTNPELHHQYQPQEHLSKIRNSVDSMFPGYTGETPDQAKKRQEKATKVIAATTQLVGKKLPGRKPDGTKVDIRITADDALTVLQKYLDSGLFSEGSVTNLDPFKILKWFGSQNQLQKDILTPERMAISEQAAEFNKNMTAEQKAAVTQYLSGNKPPKNK